MDNLDSRSSVSGEVNVVSCRVIIKFIQPAQNEAHIKWELIQVN